MKIKQRGIYQEIISAIEEMDVYMSDIKDLIDDDNARDFIHFESYIDRERDCIKTLTNELNVQNMRARFLVDVAIKIVEEFYEEDTELLSILERLSEDL